MVMDRACPKCNKRFEWTDVDVSSLTDTTKRSSLLPVSSTKCEHLICCTCLYDHRLNGGKTFLHCVVCGATRAFNARNVRVNPFACELIMGTNPKMTIFATPPPPSTTDRREAFLARYSKRRDAALREAAQAVTPRLPVGFEDQDMAAGDEDNVETGVSSPSQIVRGGANGAHAAVTIPGTDFGRTEGDDPNRADRDPTASSPASEGSRISSASSEETGGELLAERADGVLVPTTAATIESGHNSPPSFGDRNETNWSPGNDKPAVASGAYCDTRTRGFFVQGKSSLLSAGVRGGPASLATAAMPRTSSRNESEPRPGLTATARFPAFGECFGSLNLEKAFCAQGKPQLGFQHNAFAPAPAFAPTESESPPTAMGAVADASVSGTASTPVSRPATFGKGFSASSAAGFGSFGAARALTSMSGDVVRSSDAACLGTKSAQTFGNTGSFKSYSSVPPVTNTNRGVYGPFSSSSASSIPSQQLRRMNVASKPNYVSAPHTVTDGLSLLKFQSIASAFDDEEISFEEARFKDYGDGNFGTARPGVPFSLSTPASLTAGAGPSLASGTFRGPGRNVLGDAGKGNGGGEVDGGSRNRSLQSERHFFIQLTRNLQTSNRVAVDALARSDRALGDMNNLMGRVNGLQVGYTDLNDNVTFLKEQVDTLGEDDEEIREDVGVLSDNVDSLAIDTNELSSTVAALTDDVGGLESDLEGVRSDMDVLGEDIEEIGGNVNGVRADVSGLRGDILELRQRLLVLEGTLQEHENAAEVGDEGIESGEVNEAHNDLES